MDKMKEFLVAFAIIGGIVIMALFLVGLVVTYVNNDSSPDMDRVLTANEIRDSSNYLATVRNTFIDNCNISGDYLTECGCTFDKFIANGKAFDTYMANYKDYTDSQIAEIIAPYAEGCF